MQLNDMTLFRQQALIDGQWRDAPNGDVIAVTNPANGEQLGSVPKMGADETRQAIEAANRALPAWRALTAKERLFCVISYLPKATVQAAIGGIPLSMGLACGDTVLTAAVLAIVLTAPLGAFAMDLSYQKLLNRS